MVLRTGEMHFSTEYIATKCEKTSVLDISCHTTDTKKNAPNNRIGHFPMIPSFGLMARDGMQPVKSDFVAQEVGRMPKTAIFDVSWQGIPVSSHQPKQKVPNADSIGSQTCHTAAFLETTPRRGG